MRNGVAVGWTNEQRAEDQQVEGSLEHFTLQWGFAPWHVPQYTPVDDLLEQED